MENELTFTPVTDNGLLEFGETRIPLGDDNFSDLFDITGIFEDNLSFGESVISDIQISTNGYINLYGPAGYGQGQIYVLNTDLDTRPYLNLDEDAGVYFDTNADRDSVIVTWNKVALFNQQDGPTQTFQLEIIDRGADAAEIIYRFADTNGSRYYSASLNTYYGGSGLREVLRLNNTNSPLADLDTRIGNTDVAGVEQILLSDGQPIGLTLTGTEEADELTGSGLADVIDGLGGNDTITGGGGRDTITAGDGDDEVFAYAENDYYYYYGEAQTGANIDGGLGDDTLRAGDMGDTITGGEGNDLVNGGHGSNDLSGGAGNDTIRFGNEGDTTVDGGNGDDMIDGSFLNGLWSTVYQPGPYRAEIDAGEGNDTILGTNSENIIAAQAGNDSVLAGGGRDEIFGGEGNDVLTGGQGNDTIEGGAGDDFIFGALGDDLATGGEGADRFFVSGQVGDRMRITDYSAEDGDVLILDGDLFERDRIELRFETALTADGLAARGFDLGYNGETGFQSLFTFGNEADLTQITVRLPSPETEGSFAPIVFNIDDLSP